MKIVVVGGGFGGVKTALELSNKPNIHVTLISQTENFEYHGALYRSASGRSPLEVVIPLRDIFKRSTNVEVVLDRIVGLNLHKKRVVSETGTSYEYAKLIFALGSEVNYFGLEGVKEHSMSIDTIVNTIALRHELTKLFNNAKKPVHIAVVGAGPSGVELAGELQNFSKLVAEKYFKSRAKVKVTIIEGSPRVLPAMREEVSLKALHRLNKLGVKTMLNTRINSCQPGKICIDSGELEADLIVWTAGYKSSSFYIQYPDVFRLDRGKVIVDQYLRVNGWQDLYVIGDNAATPYSGMAQTALHDAKFVAGNILREMKGLPLQWYRAVHPIYVVPIGPKWAILQTQKHSISGYRGWLIRRRADLAIYRNFEPYKMALKTWRKGNKNARF